MHFSLPQINYQVSNHTFICEGDWSVLQAHAVYEQFLSQTNLPRAKSITIEGKGLQKLDSAGALILLYCIKHLKVRKNRIQLEGFSAAHQKMLDMVESKKDIISYQPPPIAKTNLLDQLGKETVFKLKQAKGLIHLVGDLSTKLGIAFLQWERFQWPGIMSTIYRTGITALPIIGLLSFLIGVVLAYQMGLQLETYGANVFIAYLSGMAIFREFSPLITAIIVAGRTSSSFTAQIGSMKINEEVDALLTMGLSPTELLVVPKVLGLLLVFPLLIFWSVLFSTLGAMLMSKMMLHVGYYDFLNRIQTTVGFKQLLLGLYKSPTFSLLIALVGCFQGFKVQSNADSLGTQTTKSVVQALFLIIVADATYSVIYSWLDV